MCMNSIRCSKRGAEGRQNYVFVSVTHPVICGQPCIFVLSRRENYIQYTKRVLMGNWVLFFFFFLQRPSTMRSENLARIFWQDFRRLHETLEISTATQVHTFLKFFFFFLNKIQYCNILGFAD